MSLFSKAVRLSKINVLLINMSCVEENFDLGKSEKLHMCNLAQSITFHLHDACNNFVYKMQKKTIRACGCFNCLGINCHSCQPFSRAWPVQNLDVAEGLYNVYVFDVKLKFTFKFTKHTQHLLALPRGNRLHIHVRFGNKKLA